MEENEMSNEEQQPVPVQQDEAAKSDGHQSITSERGDGTMSENLRNDGVCAAPNCDCISPCPVVPDDRALVAERDYLRAVVNGVHSALSRARCSCCDSELPWMDDGTKWGPCQKCALKDPAAPVPVQQDAHPSELDPLRHIAHDCKCNPVPVQQDEPEGVCAFPNCSCTENRCPAKGERGPFCDHGFHPRLCGRCAPVPEAVTDEDEVQCQMCKTVQPRPDKECGHCGAGPKYLCPIHTRPAAAPVQQEPER